MGVILWYQVNFTELKITVSNDVYSGDYLDDAEIKVEYEIGQPGKFEINFQNLPLDVNKAIADKLKSSGTGARPASRSRSSWATSMIPAARSP